ncbi:MAG TPA: hypothetical protein PLZ08_01545 [Bacillota bacterium]|jgi:uncharacterized FAD-dependent dehydrogenase|nr:hypothetical protein [Bacillota bacterium]HOL08671.1 hypothetical protein [Bacillota bacterium]HPO96627.1 hypothetical protein [Bacillota bacterium]
MWLSVNQIAVSLETDERQLKEIVAAKLKIIVSDIIEIKIRRKSLDARHKKLTFIYSLQIKLNLDTSALEALLVNNPDLTVIEEPKPLLVSPKKIQSVKNRPVIVGAGPAGLFAGLRLSLAGLRPIIFERGEGMTARIDKVSCFWETGKLDPESNIQYGLGGAGTFSDGKLTTRIKSPYTAQIIDYLIKAGAPAEIAYWQYPHIGTDLLREVVSNIERMITENGGEIKFNQKLTDFSVVDNKIVTVAINNSDSYRTDDLILAVGNSARDLYQLLYNKGIKIIAKPFAVGLRIEHPQELIDRAQYGRFAGHKNLTPAEYHLTYKHPGSNRGVYSFCMCPGGQVVGATSTVGGVVTNGMSYHARDSLIANAAIIVTVNETDFKENTPLAGMNFQIKLEQLAFELGGGNYFAPVQTVGDFIKHQVNSDFKQLYPTYKPGVTRANLWELLPKELCEAISDGIKYFGTKLKGFDWSEAVLTGVETRTSAPVRIVRNEKLESETVFGLYPCGEGAGYAGGIISSAVDGWKVAESIIAKYD